MKPIYKMGHAPKRVTNDCGPENAVSQPFSVLLGGMTWTVLEAE